MIKKTELSIGEKNQFRDAVKGITPLDNSNRLPSTPKKTKLKKAIHNEQAIEPQDSVGLSEHEYLNPVTGEQRLFYVDPSIDTRTQRSMQRGSIPIEAEFDLHGLTAAEARTALPTILAQSQQQNLRWIRIIHGKGSQQHPVLKNKLNHWLRELSNVLAFCSAVPKHGGTGAVYVLLRRL